MLKLSWPFFSCNNPFLLKSLRFIFDNKLSQSIIINKLSQEVNQVTASRQQILAHLLNASLGQIPKLSICKGPAPLTNNFNRINDHHHIRGSNNEFLLRCLLQMTHLQGIFLKVEIKCD